MVWDKKNKNKKKNVEKKLFYSNDEKTSSDRYLVLSNTDNFMDRARDKWRRASTKELLFINNKMTTTKDLVNLSHRKHRR